MKPDVYGHCCLCHENLIVPKVVNKEVKMMMSIDHDHTEFVISNLSKMVVCMCKKCKTTADLNDSTIQNDVMDSVKAGWDLESKFAPPDHDALKILFWSENIDDYVINDRLKQLGVLPNGSN